jgi:hypothetical protein
MKSACRTLAAAIANRLVSDRWRRRAARSSAERERAWEARPVISDQALPSRALADAGEHGVAGVLLGDVADQLLDDDRLADAGAAEDADLAALGEGADQVETLMPVSKISVSVRC